ncbi:hypothetical protein ACWCYL_29280 [Streptomyces sp. 900105755]|uniref:hypothetical protein n=1 Tax=Streptomyces sp. 900105755 TaxID=3154389 RepID=UPI0033217C66
MDNTIIILFIIALAGAVSVAFTYIKKLLDQVPELLESAGKARAAWERFKKPATLPSADDQEPPAAA